MMILSEAIEKAHSKSEVCRLMGWPINGSYIRKVNTYLAENNLSADEIFPPTGRNKLNRKYPLIKKECPVCSVIFETLKGHKREKTTCSHSCANTHFRSGRNNGSYKPDDKVGYRIVCFRHHEKKCIICNEQNIVTVHHYDHDHTNNDPANLVPLCPTHHQYVYSSFSHLVEEEIDKYVKNFPASK